MLAIALVLLSALLHASWNALLKREDDPRGAAVPVVLVAAVLSTAIALATPGVAFATTRAAVWSAIAGVFEGVYFFALGRALLLAPLGLVYTVSRGGALAIVWPVSVLLLSESLRVGGVVGTLILAVGLFVTSRDEARAPVDRRGLMFAFATAASIAGYHLAYKYALLAGAAPAASSALSMSVGVVLNLLVSGSRGMGRFLRRPAVLLAGALGCLSFLLFLIALSRGGAGATLTLRNTSIVFALLLARLIGERPPRLRWVGALLVSLGAVVLSVCDRYCAR